MVDKPMNPLFPSSLAVRTPLLLGAAATVLLVGCGPAEAPAAKVAPRTVSAPTLVVTQSDGVGSYVVTGTVRTALSATLSSKVMGRVTAVNVREGDTVRPGQTLLKIDARELQAATQVASANLQAARTGVGSARKAVEIETRTSRARIAQAESQVEQAAAALAAARARLDLVKAGPRTQEVAQTQVAVLQAESSLRLAQTELDRVARLVEQGALARRALDLAQNQFDLAKGQLDAARQVASIAQEGSRSQDIRAAEQAVTQAEAGLRQAQSGLAQARAAALQVELRRQDVEVAQAQQSQARASLQAAQVSQSYGQVLAPFIGRIVTRHVDPGAMAHPGAPLLTLEGGAFQLEASVPERLMSRVLPGSTATVQLDALGPKTLSGRVVEIVPQGDATSRSFLVRYQLPTVPGLKSGMFGRARVSTGTTRGITIPTTATWEREGLHYVYVVNSQGVLRLRIVTLGDAEAERVHVLSGLNQGDRIVLGPRDGLADGLVLAETGR